MVIRCDTKEELWFWLDEWEKYYIWKYNSYYDGYNSTLGGNGSRGYKHNENSIQKIKISQTGKKHSEQTKEKMKESHKGLFLGNKHPLYGKIGEDSPRYGQKHSTESKEKMSKARKQYYEEHGAQGRSVICLDTGEVFTSIKEAHEKYGGSIGACCRGKLKTAGKCNGKKLHWLYYDEYLQNKKEDDSDG